MKLRAAICIAVAVLLSGCSDADWDHLLSFGSSGSSEVSSDQAPPADAPTPPPPAETATAPQPSYSVTTTVTTETQISVEYCRTVAQNTGAVATRDGMDGAEQQHVADVTYRQCLALYGSSGR